MAIFNPTIYKDISGSVGNVTSYKVGKTQIARAKTGFMKDAKTPKQLQQRATAPRPAKNASTVSPETTSAR